MRVTRYLRLILEMAAAILSWWLAFLVRFEGTLPENTMNQFLVGLPVAVAARTFTYHAFGLHKRIWRYTGMKDLTTLGMSTALGSVLLATVVLFLVHGQGYSRSVFIIDFMFYVAMTAGMRFLIRVLKEKHQIRPKKERRILVVGAGDTGEMMVREMQHTPEKGCTAVAFADDDVGKIGHRIHNVPVLGNIAEIPEIVLRKSIDDIVIAIPNASGKTLRRVLKYCRKSSADAKALPKIADIIAGQVTIDRMRNVGVEDLLGREPVSVDLDEICGYISEQCVLVTGAGGSIGSELSRQIAAYMPSKLILIDHDENAIFEISRELSALDRKPELVSLVLDILDHRALERILQEHRPKVIFHAAAHKHVPLMEAQVLEAVKNNVRGTLNVASLAKKHGVETFVYISTDKAVEPVNVMGMTKRTGELIVHAANADKSTSFVSVRFGNVLGSNGSAIPTFKRQIADGGPVTVTHRDMERYFMTIQEAVQLVIQTGAFGDRGETFVLDMGNPVRISKLVEDLIRLSGFEPGEDIDIVFTGLRPGEKLTERLAWEGKETVSTTSHPRITVVKNGAASSPDEIFGRVEELLSAADEQDEEQTQRLLEDLAKR
jgi:FlaA1/EpsC-like NDP-sugar epimerase